jgi:hypothetical protein
MAFSKVEFLWVNMSDNEIAQQLLVKATDNA